MVSMAEAAIEVEVLATLVPPLPVPAAICDDLSALAVFLLKNEMIQVETTRK